MGAARSSPAEASGLALGLEALQPVDARFDLVDALRRCLDLLAQAVAACLVVGRILIRKLHQGHVLFQTAQHGQLEEALRKELYLVADLGSDKAISLEHEHLNLVHGLVDLGRVRGDVSEPPGERLFCTCPSLDLLRDALLGVLEGRQRGVLQLLSVGAARRVALEEDPRICKGGREHIVEELCELLQLPDAGPIVSPEDELLDHLILLDELRMLGVEGGVEVRLRSALQLLHELDDRLLLVHKEPLDALPDILHTSLQGQVGLIAQQLHNDVTPSQGAHGDAARLDHVPLLRGKGDLREAQEDLDLDHEPPKLGAAVDLHIEGGHLNVVAKVVDVVVEA
mmetsp:Transcript_100638/g.204000  ORF Transcript_100638/g.204000 Transcript_100638/m.204000 type:complete len:340 (+) Transcript_100638:103-1122(+)